MEKVPERYYSVREVAELFDVHINTIYNLVQRNQIPYFRVGRQYRFKESDLKKWIESHGLAWEELEERASKALQSEQRSTAGN